MLSYWERVSFLDWDVIVVGAGIVGLSAALRLAERGREVLVLERGLLPTGASTKNAGFACFGSATELMVDLGAMGEDRTVALVERRWRGLCRLAETLGEEPIGLERCGGYELLGAERLDVLGALPGLNALLRPLFGADVFSPADPAPFGFGRTGAIVANRFEGGLHTGKMMRRLLDRCRAAGVTVWTGAEVGRLAEEEGGVRVEAGELPLRARQVVVCTNAFAGTLLPELEVVPGRGQVLITERCEPTFRGVFHMDEGYFYFRELDGRVLLGGGRNLDVEGETTTELAVTEKLQRELERVLREVVLPGRDVPIAQRWAGVMAFGPTREPIVRRVSERVAVAVRLGGMGVAVGMLLGEEVAGMVEG